MPIGLIGRKCGMTRVFTEAGESVPVTVIEVLPNRVTRVKTAETDGYRAVQVTTGNIKANRLTKPLAGEFRKAGVEAGRGFWEFRLDENEGDDLAAGSEITVDALAEAKLVDVVGTSIGKGFAGAIKRHNFSSQRMSHGNSLSHRAPGSIGQNQTPGRVFPGKKMAGHLGNARRTVQNLEVVRVDAEKNLLLIKGGVPGAKGGDLVIRPAVKGAA
ncbi:50S ribosomal protein L3 [Oceanococcus atlanticus]|uniref:Large ribosomal subunit protein uL3 n=1 Tax=Oceanococcus atlanticus TaxID=1317117 RepID=A0A1Y1SI44_9GAMM|nr:50S ribosomal protein L3 [Oceanococcus atlanticus]ORE88981.1 50S ribosomal protein L3 [Oceanococcus atlanticus]RZO83141.1 MAG: 50S ribosomal protein L3 [Oceanococcus sp.]